MNRMEKSLRKKRENSKLVFSPSWTRIDQKEGKERMSPEKHFQLESIIMLLEVECRLHLSQLNLSLQAEKKSSLSLAARRPEHICLIMSSSYFCFSLFSFLTCRMIQDDMNMFPHRRENYDQNRIDCNWKSSEISWTVLFSALFPWQENRPTSVLRWLAFEQACLWIFYGSDHQNEWKESLSLLPLDESTNDDLASPFIEWFTPEKKWIVF